MQAQYALKVQKATLEAQEQIANTNQAELDD